LARIRNSLVAKFYGSSEPKLSGSAAIMARGHEIKLEEKG